MHTLEAKVIQTGLSVWFNQHCFRLGVKLYIVSKSIDLLQSLQFTELFFCAYIFQVNSVLITSDTLWTLNRCTVKYAQKKDK